MRGGQGTSHALIAIDSNVQIEVHCMNKSVVYRPSWGELERVRFARMCARDRKELTKARGATDRETF